MTALHDCREIPGQILIFDKFPWEASDHLQLSSTVPLYTNPAILIAFVRKSAILGRYLSAAEFAGPKCASTRLRNYWSSCGANLSTKRREFQLFKIFYIPGKILFIEIFHCGVCWKSLLEIIESILGISCWKNVLKWIFLSAAGLVLLDN